MGGRSGRAASDVEISYSVAVPGEEEKRTASQPMDLSCHDPQTNQQQDALPSLPETWAVLLPSAGLQCGPLEGRYTTVL